MDSSESSGESVSGFSSSSHSYHSAVGGEAEDGSLVCTSTVTVKEAVAAHGAGSSAVIKEPNGHSGTPEKPQPPVPPKPKRHYMANDALCDKVRHKVWTYSS